MTKRGILTNGDYNKHGKLGNNSFKVCQNLNEMTNLARIYKRFDKNKNQMTKQACR